MPNVNGRGRDERLPISERELRRLALMIQKGAPMSIDLTVRTYPRDRHGASVPHVMIKPKGGGQISDNQLLHEEEERETITGTTSSSSGGATQRQQQQQPQQQQQRNRQHPGISPGPGEFYVKIGNTTRQVDPAVMKAESDYFRYLINQGKRMVVRDDLDLAGFDNVLHMLMSGDDSRVLRMPKVMLDTCDELGLENMKERIVDTLIDSLQDCTKLESCLCVLELCKKYGVEWEVEDVKAHVFTHTRAMCQTQPPDGALHDIQLIIDTWRGPEKLLFSYINRWISVKYAERKDLKNDLMDVIRFGLMSPEQLEDLLEIHDGDCTEEGAGEPWLAAALAAARCSKLPVHLKVLEASHGLQFTLRSRPAPVLFTTTTAGFTNGVSNTLYALGCDYQWKVHSGKMTNVPKFIGVTQAQCVVVNNFLVTCTSATPDQQWVIFDPRTLVWHHIAPMDRPKVDFILVAHGEHLYTVGGRYVSKPNRRNSDGEKDEGYSYDDSYALERYSFRTNSWTTYCEVPFTSCTHSACVVDDTLYVSLLAGPANAKQEKLLYALDLSPKAEEPTWRKRRPHRSGHRTMMSCLYAMKFKGKSVIVALNEELDVEMYTPSKNRWQTMNTEHDISRHFSADCKSVTLAKGNSLFMLNQKDRFMHFGGENDLRMNQEWKFPDMTQPGRTTKPPFSLPGKSVLFGGVLALPAME